jgi:hypothetical protein
MHRNPFPEWISRLNPALANTVQPDRRHDPCTRPRMRAKDTAKRR